MGSYRLTREIRATPERVFQGLTDAAVIVDWMDLRSITDATGPLDEAGTRFTMVVRGPWRLQCEVISSRSPTLHEMSGRGPLGASFRMVATLAASDDGTRLELLTDYSMPLGAIGRWIDRLWLERRPRTVANRELDRLVDLLSDGDGGSSTARERRRGAQAVQGIG
jgi:hypothetical protein